MQQLTHGQSLQGGQLQQEQERPSITVTTGAAGQNGNIRVTATNSCGTSTPLLWQ